MAPDKIYINGFSAFATGPVKDGEEYIRKDALIEWLMNEMDRSEKFSTCEHYSNVIEHLEEM